MLVGVVTLTLQPVCSGGRPSARDGESAFQDRIALLRLEKTSGQQDGEFGVPIDHLEWPVNIDFPERCRWVMGPFGAMWASGPGHHLRSPGRALGTGWMESPRYLGVSVSRGGRATLADLVSFRRVEEGWRATDCRVARYQLRGGE